MKWLLQKLKQTSDLSRINRSPVSNTGLAQHWRVKGTSLGRDDLEIAYSHLQIGRLWFCFNLNSPFKLIFTKISNFLIVKSQGHNASFMRPFRNIWHFLSSHFLLPWLLILLSPIHTHSLSPPSPSTFCAQPLNVGIPWKFCSSSSLFTLFNQGAVFLMTPHSLFTIQTSLERSRRIESIAPLEYPQSCDIQWIQHCILHPHPWNPFLLYFLF